MNTKLIGDIGEQFACNILEEKGYKIVERNAKYCDCEIDIIAECCVDKNGNLINQTKNRFTEKISKLFRFNDSKNTEKVIVFCEVKTRSSKEMGMAEYAVTPYKMGRYITAAKEYLKLKRLSGVKVRFDVFAINDDGYNHIENAFCENDAKYKRNRY